MLAANQASTGLLTAQGRMAARSHDADPYNFVPPTNPLLEPAEPSSHSSSVSAHPQVQYMTKLRHQAPAGARVIGLADISHGVSRATQPLAAAAAATASSPPQSPPPLYEKLADRERKPSLNNSRRLHSYQAIGSSGANGLLSMQPVIAPPAESHAQASATATKQQQQPARPTQYRSVSAPNESSPSPPPLAALSSPAAAAGAPAAATPAAPASSEQRAPPRAKAVRQASSSSKADKQEWERQRKAGQRGMPSDALVIGPGESGGLPFAQL